ncbi:MAG: hypothetical protein VW270_26840 [Candidatus Poseidoniales archaeon]|jgi:hypothetical protein
MKYHLNDMGQASRFWYLNFYRANDQLIHMGVDEGQFVYLEIPQILEDYIDTMPDKEFEKYINWDYNPFGDEDDEDWE